MAGTTCDVCGTDRMILGVRASLLGPVSFCYCAVCSGMAAEPVAMVKATIGLLGGVENAHPRAPLFYYDPEMDMYIDARDERGVMIVTSTGESFLTKEDFYKHLEEQGVSTGVGEAGLPPEEEDG